MAALLAAGSMAVWLVGCGGGTSISGGSNPPRGTISVSITDPPSCRFPAGNYQSVFVTIRSVQAHISTSAGDNDGGWQELAPQLANAPLQVDLLGIPQGGCILSMLGSNVSLPAGDYQQIRLILLANNATSGPSPNACSSVNAFNCVVLHPSAGGTTHRLLLNSQDNTGLKIAPGQIVGGPIRVGEGQHVDMNIDFNTCASLQRQGNGEFRLRPVLTAGQVSAVNTGLSGRVVDEATMQPLTGTAEVLVALEQPDSGGIDRIIMQTAADASGNFNFCPVPAGTYDLVAVGQDGAGVTYGATVLTGVSGGSNVGNIPLIAQAGNPTPATIEGVVTSENAGAGASVDAAVSAFQSITVGGNARQVTIPQFNNSVSSIATASTPVAMFASPCPGNTFCEGYSLRVPAQNPRFGAFVSGGGTTFSPPAAGPVPFTIEVKTFRPMSGGTATCSPSMKTTTMDSMGAALNVTAGATVTAARLDFTACN